MKTKEITQEKMLENPCCSICGGFSPPINPCPSYYYNCDSDSPESECRVLMTGNPEDRFIEKSIELKNESNQNEPF